MLGRKAVAAGAVFVTTLLNAGPVCAQGGAQASAPEVRRPFRGLFGGPPSADSKQSLVLSASVFAAYDDNVFEALADRRLSTPWLQKNGWYQGANAGLNYGFDLGGERVSLQGGAGGQLHYYRLENLSDVVPSSQADVGFSARLTRSLRFSARQSLAYASLYNAALVPGVDESAGHDIGVVVDPDLSLFELRSIRSASSVALTQRIGKHAALSAGYNYRTRHLIDSELPDSPFRNYGSHSGSAGFHYARPITRHATLNLGYGIRVSDRKSGTGEPDIMHNIDAGVSYSRALSFSRRTSLSFGSGSAIAVSDRLDDPDSPRRARARLTGSASLVHELGRTWTANLTYTRGFRTRDGFDELYFSDGVTAGIGGLVTRRLMFSAGTAWSGASSESNASNHHRGQSAQAQATYALTRAFALFARYVYYQNDYRGDLALDPRVPRALERHGIRVGLTTSVPLIR